MPSRSPISPFAPLQSSSAQLPRDNRRSRAKTCLQTRTGVTLARRLSETARFHSAVRGSLFFRFNSFSLKRLPIPERLKPMRSPYPAAKRDSKDPYSLINSRAFGKSPLYMGGSLPHDCSVRSVLSRMFAVERGGIVDTTLHLEPISSRNWATYAVALVGVLTTFQKSKATAC